MSERLTFEDRLSIAYDELGLSAVIDTDLPNDFDEKHREIVRSANAKIGKLTRKNVRDWEMQSDNAFPNLIGSYNYSDKSLKATFMRTLRFLRHPIYESLFAKSLLRDIENIEKAGYEHLLKRHPVVASPFCEDSFLVNGYSINYRWLRYIYCAGRILEKASTVDTLINVGPFYGGLEYIVGRERDDINLVLVDFEHQLLRAFLFLSEAFPQKQFLFVKDEDVDLRGRRGAIVLCPQQNYSRLTLLGVTGFVNTFGLGEMSEKDFELYMSSPILKYSKWVFLVNRFVSGPWFEPTYKVGTTLLDYTRYVTPDYLDVFPIYNSKLNRYQEYPGLYPTSSQYFELFGRPKEE